MSLSGVEAMEWEEEVAAEVDKGKGLSSLQRETRLEYRKRLIPGHVRGAHGDHFGLHFLGALGVLSRIVRY